VAFLLATAFRIALVFVFPTIHGGDAAARLANAGTIVLGYQLPLPQLFVVLGKAVLDDPVLVRLIFCVWGGLLAAGVTALLSLGVDSKAAGFGAILLSFDPLLTHYSIVPYQEPVAYGLLAWAFYNAGTGRGPLGPLLMASACLSRYEAWLFLPPFFWVARSRAAGFIASVPVFTWVLWWQGLAPSGLYVVDLDLHSVRLSRVAFLTRKFLEYETLFVPGLAGLALLLTFARPGRLVIRAAISLAVPIAVVVAFGHEYPAGSGLMSERLIHLPVLLALLLAPIALARIAAGSRVRFGVCLAATLLVAGRNIRFETSLLDAAAREPDLALARDVARAIDFNRSKGECVTVHAPSVDPALLDAYVAKVSAGFGDANRARARALSLATVSPDRDRIAAHLRAAPGTIKAETGCPLVVFIDAAIAEATPESKEPMSLLAEITAGSRRARLLRIRR